MAAWFEEQDLPGFAAWMRIQVQEEQFHAMKMFDHVLERGGRIDLGAIDAPPGEWKSPKADVL